MTDRYRGANLPTTELLAEFIDDHDQLVVTGCIRGARRRSSGKRVRVRPRHDAVAPSSSSQRRRVPLTLTYDPESRAAGSLPQGPAAPIAPGRVLQRRQRTP